MLHNRYRATGGEERAVANLVEMLSRHGHAVRLLERSSARSRPRRGRGGDDRRRRRSPTRSAARSTEFGAEVVHAHNVHPAVRLARARRPPARPAPGSCCTCTTSACSARSGSRFATGHPCFSCRGRNTLPGTGPPLSRPVSEAVVYAAGLSLQQPRLLAHADRFITVSQFTAGKLIGHGLPGRPHRRAAELHSRTASAAPDERDPRRLRAWRADGSCPRRASTPRSSRRGQRSAARDRRRRSRAGRGWQALGAGADVRLLGQVDSGADAELRRGAAFCPGAVALRRGLPVRGDRGAGRRRPGDRQHPRGPARTARTRQLVARCRRRRCSGRRQLSRLWRDPAARSAARRTARSQTARELLSEERYHAELMRIYAQARVNRRPATGD